MILQLNDFYTPEECAAEIAYAEQVGLVSQTYGVGFADEARKRASIDNQERVAMIWKKLNTPLELARFYEGLQPEAFDGDLSAWQPIGLNARLRYYHYEPGARFPEHFDIFYRVNDNTRTFLTFILYLNDGFKGGETRFADKGQIIDPKVGSAIIFPHELRHEGMVVTSGCKTILRTDVMYRRA